MLVCARLRHVAGTQWGNKKYMNMKHLEATFEDASIEALAKPERRLVLEIIDAKDQMAETASIDSFSAGFELACRLCSELVNIQKSIPS